MKRIGAVEDGLGAARQCRAEETPYATIHHLYLLLREGQTYGLAQMLGSDNLEVLRLCPREQPFNDGGLWR